MKIIGERLRSLRESVRLSQAKLAKEFDVSQSALARYEIDDSTPTTLTCRWTTFSAGRTTHTA